MDHITDNLKPEIAKLIQEQCKKMIDESMKAVKNSLSEDLHKFFDGKLKTISSKIDGLSIKIEKISKDMTSGNHVVSTLNLEVQSLQARLFVIDDNLRDVDHSQKFINEEFELQKKMISELEGSIAGLRSWNNAIQYRYGQLSENVQKTTHSMDELDQYMRKLNIEFHGVPVSKDEDTEKIVKHLGSLLGTEIHSNDISTTHRLPSTKDNLPAPIIARFNSRKICSKILKARTQISSITEFGITGMKSLYINENLTKTRRETLSEARKLKKMGRLHSVWINNGNVFIRKKEGLPKILVRHKEELKSL